MVARSGNPFKELANITRAQVRRHSKSVWNTGLVSAAARAPLRLGLPTPSLDYYTQLEKYS